MSALKNNKSPRLIRKLLLFVRRASLPGFDKVPIADVIGFFIDGLKNGDMATRASSVAYNFFLAFFPALLMLVSMIPYIPIDNLQEELMTTLRDIMPINVFHTIRDTVEEIVTRKRTDLLSFGFIAALIFATNGISALIRAFNTSYHTILTRKWIDQQLVSVLLVMIFCFLVTIALTLVIFSGTFLNYLENEEIITNRFLLALLNNGKWLIILTFLFLGISFLFYLAPSRRQKFRFISAGASLATVIMVVTSLGFSAFINNFGQYNKLYGSIGTMIAFLIWIYFNSAVLLIGFELNASIKNARLQKKSIREEK
ncbi:MAG: YihY/virulence factor BrkB family protein [Bacteroidetes bacterium]|jgi:membrane protein|nr:YihY/virulence factor BrkB family protein [Bacteroidota bacterium]MBT3749608.1 YihY/virulence factor BrkB family protein [Bacteroidota bacterium]MBT4401694.1 YihY/virulence factor BrkB family protein [Bacteroidota bacterium]MBT4411436.1 YihY/virulence factor BrkB family protein [Bacteroidota bacterium]MBT5425132.1 YihY/virulence factor BrkB family protein [Bacteroidota bacterium]